MRLATHPNSIYRVARGDPWTIRPPRMHNRFDIADPENPVTTLYTGESTEAALAEVLAPFRPDLTVIAAVGAIPSDDDREPLSGLVPKAWLLSRRIGRAKIRPQAVIIDITQPETIAALRANPNLAAKAVECGYPDIDQSSLTASGPSGRRFTQSVAAHIYNEHFSGMRYGSRLGSTYHCIAGFVSLDSTDVADSEFVIETFETLEIASDDSNLREVAQIFGLRVAG